MHDLLIITTDPPPLGKGHEDFPRLLECEKRVIGTVIPRAANYLLIYNSDSKRPTRWMDLAAQLKEQHPEARIWNDPNITDVGDKIRCLQQAQQLSLIRVPQFIAPPVIIKKNRGTKAGDIRYKKHYAVQFIPPKGGIFVSVRLQFVGKHLIDYFPRPAKHWNIHAYDQDFKLAAQYDNLFTTWWQQQDSDLMSELQSTFGWGTFTMDCVWDSEALWFCEVGHKLFEGSWHRANRSAGSPVKKKTIFQVVEELKTVLREGS